MLRAWFTRHWGARPSIDTGAPPVMLERVRDAVEAVQRSSNEVRERIKPYQDAENPLFALLSRAINKQQAEIDDRKPNS